jgi:hypothetical protein
VRLGPVVEGLRVVRECLESGETVVVNGLHRVRPGMKVAATTVAMDTPGVPAGGDAATTVAGAP